LKRLRKWTFWEVTLEKYDADKDGRLSPAEISKAIHGFGDYDLNKDGFIDREEWEAYIRLRSATNNLVAIQPQGRGDLSGKVLWRYRKSLPNIPSPVLYGGALFLIKDGGLLTTLDPATGAVFKQARVTGALDQYWASPVAADGRVYLLSQSCKLSVVKARPQWDVMQVNDLDDECFATPAIANRAIFVRTRGWLYCFRQSIT
jgi:outer membrane protein assembly factor BamB